DALRTGRTELAAERMASVRRNAADAVSATLRPGLVLGVRTDNGTVFVRGAEPPGPALNGLDADTLAGAGSDGQAREAFGSPYLFFSFPLLGSDKEARAQGMLIVGGPLLPEGTADQVALESGLAALGLVQSGKLVSIGGAEKSRLPEALREAPVGTSAVVARGPAGSLGFLRLPLFASGPEPALRVALRRSVPGYSLEALALVSTEPAMSALADTQRFSFGAMLFLLAGLAALWLWMGQDMPALRPHTQEDTEPGTRRKRGLFGLGPTQAPVFRAPETRTEVEPRAVRPRSAIELEPTPPPPPAESTAEPEPATAAEPFPQGEGLPGPRTPREPPRDDLAALLDAMPPPPDPTPAPLRPPSQRLSPSPATPPRPLPPRPPPAPEPLDYDHQPTTAYPVPNLPDFNLPPASALGPAANAIPEATRVADVSPDLLLASSRVSGPRPQPLPRAVAPDEVHFQDVFHEFLAVRERCGEGGDGLTFEKFAGKLRKNRDQLVFKYGCRTVRFQVYVKDGRAALKATPVRD
ncbi:MAG TPA: MXAN_5187 family protein, partial [Myxococcaceae bacterium]|nr:MXAN_5187 family protein [Myxococcaceae bacterium]